VLSSSAHIYSTRDLHNLVQQNSNAHALVHVFRSIPLFGVCAAMKVAAASLLALAGTQLSAAFAPPARLVVQRSTGLAASSAAPLRQQSRIAHARMSAAAAPSTSAATLTPPHGGELVDLMVKSDADKQVREH
jgi:hypothetical protein